MLFQSQAVDRILSESGQLSIDPSDLGLTPDRISRDIFIPSVIEYTSIHRPSKNRSVEVSSGGTELLPLPYDFAQVREIKPLGSPGFSGLGLMGLRKVPLWRTTPLTGADYRIDVEKRELLLPWGVFAMSYLANAEPTCNVEGYAILGTRYNSTTFRFPVPKELCCGFTLDIECGRKFVIDTAALTATPTVDPQTLNNPITVTSITKEEHCCLDYYKVVFSRVATGPVKLWGLATHPFAPSLSFEDDELFFLSFLCKFGHAFAMARAQIEYDDSPIKLEKDGFLQWVRDKETQYQQKLETNQKWWSTI